MKIETWKYEGLSGSYFICSQSLLLIEQHCQQLICFVNQNACCQSVFSVTYLLIVPCGLTFTLTQSNKAEQSRIELALLKTEQNKIAKDWL